MRKPGNGRLTRRTITATAAALAVVVAGGGYALASTDGNGPAASNNGPTLLYLVGKTVIVPPNSTGQNATVCPSNTYPVGGGPSSARDQWELQWSNASRSDRRAHEPDEWTVRLYNNSNQSADFRVYVVCSTAGSVASNY
jgi:hypothetical protein